MINVNKFRNLLLEFTWEPANMTEDPEEELSLIMLGLYSEIGEVGGCAIKDPVAYKIYDEEHVLQEVGDVVAYIMLLEEKLFVPISESLYLTPNDFEPHNLMLQGFRIIDRMLCYSLKMRKHIEAKDTENNFSFFSLVNGLMLELIKLLPKGKTLSDACEATYNKQLKKLHNAKFPNMGAILLEASTEPEEVEYWTVSKGFMIKGYKDFSKVKELEGRPIEVIDGIMDPIIKANIKKNKSKKK